MKRQKRQKRQELTALIGVRFTPEQSMRVRTEARKRGLALSTWLRVLALDATDERSAP